MKPILLSEQQKIVRDVSPLYLAQQARLNPGLSTVLEDLSKRLAPTPKTSAPPTTLAELSEAMRDQRLRKYQPPPSYNALEPLTLEMVCDIMGPERAAREAMMEEYTQRTGQQVALCDHCHMGVVDEEEQDGFETVTVPYECEECDGLGVVEVFGEETPTACTQNSPTGHMEQP